MVALIIIVVLVAIVIALIVMRNNLVVARQRVKNAWSQIDVQLQRRFDLIPNLVETVKGYMAHESDVLEKVTAYVLRGQMLKQLKIKQVLIVLFQVH